MTFLESLSDLGLGTKIHGGTVIAWGHYNDDYLSIVLLLDDANRVPNEVNYLVALTDHDGNIIQQSTFPNIVPAVDAYADEYGMDY